MAIFEIKFERPLVIHPTRWDDSSMQRHPPAYTANTNLLFCLHFPQKKKKKSSGIYFFNDPRWAKPITAAGAMMANEERKTRTRG
jgi:hypothetical protein